MPISQDIAKAFQPCLPERAFQEALARTGPALERLRAQAVDGSLALLGLPARTEDLAPVEEVAATLRGSAEVVLLGTGGSALGGQCLAQLAGYGVPGVAPFLPGPRVHFMDNLDPVSFESLLGHLDLARTTFVAISKSGGTGETLMQTSAAMAALERAGLGGAVGRRFVGLSEPLKAGGANALRALLEPHGVRFLDHDTGVGGRYSVLTNVGLLPAATLGLDIRAIRNGAAGALAPALTAADPVNVPAAVGAALQIAAMASGLNITVVMPYTDRLERMTKWFVQLWAESNGKDGQGSQPVATLGPVDQHSAQQLFLAGPRDKLFTVITVATKGLGFRVDAAGAARIGDAGFAGKTIGDLVSAQGEAMVDTFAKNGCPVRRMHIERLDESALGHLLMHFMLETIIAGYAMGVDPFDQPAVEEAKLLAKQYLGEGR